MIHSTLSPFEKRAMDMEFRRIGLTSAKASEATRVASRHLDVAMEVRRREWAAMAGLTGNQLAAPEEVEG